MPLFPELTIVFLDTIVAGLVPWFMAAAGGDLDLARHTVRTLLASFDARTEEEVRLAAEITSFGLGALAALSKSVDPDLPLNAVLRLRGSANTLQRSKNQCQRALDKLREGRRLARAEATSQAETAAKPTAPTQPQALDPPPAASRPQPPPSVPGQPEAAITLSRQQRRAAQRARDKAQRKQAEQIRRTAMRALRTAPPPPAVPPVTPRRPEPHAPSSVATVI